MTERSSHDAASGDPAPTPWTWDGTTLTDASGKLVCILAQRLCQQEVLIAEIMAASEMHRLLIAVEEHLSAVLSPRSPRQPPLSKSLLDEVRAMVTRLGGDR